MKKVIIIIIAIVCVVAAIAISIVYIWREDEKMKEEQARMADSIVYGDNGGIPISELTDAFVDYLEGNFGGESNDLPPDNDVSETQHLVSDEQTEENIKAEDESAESSKETEDSELSDYEWSESVVSQEATKTSVEYTGNIWYISGVNKNVFTTYIESSVEDDVTFSANAYYDMTKLSQLCESDILAFNWRTSDGELLGLAFGTENGTANNIAKFNSDGIVWFPPLERFNDDLNHDMAMAIYFSEIS